MLYDVPSVDPNSADDLSESFDFGHHAWSIVVQVQVNWNLSRLCLRVQNGPKLDFRPTISSPSNHLGEGGIIEWERECQKIAWSKGTENNFENFVVSRSKNENVKLTVINPDPLNLWKG